MKMLRPVVSEKVILRVKTTVDLLIRRRTRFIFGAERSREQSMRMVNPFIALARILIPPHPVGASGERFRSQRVELQSRSKTRPMFVDVLVVQDVCRLTPKLHRPSD